MKIQENTEIKDLINLKRDGRNYSLRKIENGLFYNSLHEYFNISYPDRTDNNIFTNIEISRIILDKVNVIIVPQTNVKKDIEFLTKSITYLCENNESIEVIKFDEFNIQEKNSNYEAIYIGLHFGNTKNMRCLLNLIALLNCDGNNVKFNIYTTIDGE